MQSLYFILLLATAAFASIKDKTTFKESTAVNHLAKIKDAPYVGLIRDDSGGLSYYCGTTILTEFWLLTAARCVLWGTKASIPSVISVWTGVDSLSSNETMHQVDQIHIHEKYIRDGVDYNIALLKLRNKLQFGDDRKAISLIKANDEPKISDVLQIHGFPRTFDEKIKPLTSVSMKIVDEDLCQKKYPEINNLSSTETFCGEVKTRCSRPELCAFNYGDSAVIDGKLVGILTIETVQNYPGIFTNLNRYNDWIFYHIPELKQ